MIIIYNLSPMGVNICLLRPYSVLINRNRLGLKRCANWVVGNKYF